MKHQRDWKEHWIDRMGLIVALSCEQRFHEIQAFKLATKNLPEDSQKELWLAIRKRFTPTNGKDGCQSACSAIEDITT